MSLRGCDLSHYNTTILFNKRILEDDFIIIKATEGVTYKDPTFTERQKALVDFDKLRGYYHYARPENNKPEDEAKHFVEVVGADTENALLILDWEGKAISLSFEWALRWCNAVKNLTGCTPIIYASANVCKAHAREYKYWWVAHYNKACSDGCSHDGVNELITQYNSDPYDMDVFHGTIKDWKALTKHPADEVEVVARWTEGAYEYIIERRVKNG